eukprot:81162-Alexandrium_andersonii.AAC.1
MNTARGAPPTRGRRANAPPYEGASGRSAADSGSDGAVRGRIPSEGARSAAHSGDEGAVRGRTPSEVRSGCRAGAPAPPGT